MPIYRGEYWYMASATVGFGKRKAPAPGQKPLNAPGDKRDAVRVSAFKNAQLILSDQAVQSCIARDISEDGCRISLMGAENLPEDLLIKLDAVTRPKLAKIIWRDGDEAGLQFLV